MKAGTNLGVQAKAHVDAGRLVPDDLVIGLVDEVFQSLKGASFILDGFPRTVPQAEALERQLSRHGLSIGRAVFLQVARDVLLERLAGRRVCKACGATYHAKAKPPQKEGVCDVCGGEVIQRSDDRESVVSTRLQAYDESTSPLREFYRTKGTYREIDGVGEAEDVFRRIQKAVS